ncbi:2'-5' RNA ligase family protein [Candidatus Woesearchaeota archaeon]|nr:2'-5' RNA ligase family protein [Candidatus Woesearchaeota archaeon]
MKQFCVVISLKGIAAARVRRLQHALSLKTGSSASVRFWKPHLTVGSGIIVPNHELDSLAVQFQSALHAISPFSVRIHGYGFMNKWTGGIFGKSPYVVYLRIGNSRALRALVMSVQKVTRRYPLFYRQPRPYTPHVTLAFSDLTKAGFQHAKYFLKRKTFTGTIKVDQVALLHKDRQGRWVEYKKFKLGSR